MRSIDRRDQPPRAGGPRFDLFVYIALLGAIWAVYAQVRTFSFVNLDDSQAFVLGDPRIQSGITLDGLRWALVSRDAGWWFPLTRLSHMLDCQFFGLQSGWHHLSSVTFHALSALLLFALLNRATRSRWPSAFVAFVFALHPLHVESVAWVSERKDVLAAFFFLVTLWIYVFYAERPGWSLYLASLVAFCAGLMAKSMIVTLPFVLLLLDIWPLRRLALTSAASRARGSATGVGWRRALLEKVPFVAVSAAAGVITYLAQRDLGAVKVSNAYPIGLRIGNALLSYVVYISDTVWPSGLAVFYPYPEHVSAWAVSAAGLAIAAISVLVLRLVREKPYLTVGWLWYLGMLLPVIGLIQAGKQARADRYMYLPMIGLSVMMAFGLAEVFKRWAAARTPVIIVGAAACTALAVSTWIQIQYWRNSGTLFEHAIAVTKRNYLAQACLGSYLLVDVRGRLPEAIAHLEEAVRLNPNMPEARSNLGFALLAVPGRVPEAVRHLEIAVRLKPDLAEAQNNLAAALSQLPDRLPEALSHREAALRINPRLQSPQEILDRLRQER